MLSMCHQIAQVHAQSVSRFPVHAVMYLAKCCQTTCINRHQAMSLILDSDSGVDAIALCTFSGALLALGADANLVFPDHDNDNGWPQASSPTAVAHTNMACTGWRVSCLGCCKTEFR